MWCLWYADGSTFDSTQGAPADVPGYGLQVIVQPDRTPGVGNVGYVCMAGFDWYYWHVADDEWAGAMGDGSMWDLILHREPIIGVCQGRRMSHVRYQAVLAEAKAWAREMNLPPKSAFRPDEKT